jgi:hypothetical protein
MWWLWKCSLAIAGLWTGDRFVIYNSQQVDMLISRQRGCIEVEAQLLETWITFKYRCFNLRCLLSLVNAQAEPKKCVSLVPLISQPTPELDLDPAVHGGHGNLNIALRLELFGCKRCTRRISESKSS